MWKRGMKGITWTSVTHGRKDVVSASRNSGYLLLIRDLFVRISAARGVTVCVNPSTHRSHQVASAFLKRTRPRAERAGGQPLGRLTSGFLHLKALEPPYNPPREAPLKIRLRWSRRL